MDIRRFAAFVAIADAGGISAAAAVLGYAQSSVSGQLKALEAELGVQLVARGPAGSKLTPAGVKLLPHAREALRLAERIRRAVAGPGPELRVGALESLAAEWLPDILTARRLRATQPTSADTPISLRVADRVTLSTGLLDDALDVIFVFDNGVPAIGPKQRVGEEPVVLVAAPDHPLAGRPVITEADVLTCEFLVAELGCTAQLLLDRFGRDLTQRIPVAMVTGSLAALRQLTVNGHGVALLPRLTAAADLASGALIELPPPSPQQPIGIEARWRAGADEVVAEQVRSLVQLAGRNTLRAASSWVADGGRAGDARGHGYDGRSARTLRRPASPLRPSPQENLL